MSIRRRKMFPGDLKSPTVPKDQNAHMRLGVISSVDAQKGTCSIRWLDGLGFRNDVIITQGNHKEWNIPEKNAMVLVELDAKQQVRILRYINIGHESRVTKTFTLPRVKEGEKLWEGPNGSFIHMQQGGNITISTASEGYWILENSTGTLKSETVNWKVTTEGGVAYLGQVKRFVINPDGTQSLNIISYPPIIGNVLTEYSLKVLEYADNVVGESGTDNPIAEITLGTVVDKNGNVVDKENGIAIPLINPLKQIAARIKLKNGVQIDIDKEGRCNIKNIKININNGSIDAGSPDAILGLENNYPNLGTKGQHAARVGDKVLIPLNSLSINTEVVNVNKSAVKNLATLTQLAASFLSSAPGNPCVLNPALLPTSPLEGIITEGATSVIIGDW